MTPQRSSPSDIGSLRTALMVGELWHIHDTQSYHCCCCRCCYYCCCPDHSLATGSRRDPPERSASTAPSGCVWWPTGCRRETRSARGRWSDALPPTAAGLTVEAPPPRSVGVAGGATQPLVAGWPPRRTCRVCQNCQEVDIISALKLNFRKYPAIHTHYSWSNCTISK